MIVGVYDHLKIRQKLQDNKIANLKRELTRGRNLLTEWTTMRMKIFKIGQYGNPVRGFATIAE
jgi:hypothetical protein